MLAPASSQGISRGHECSSHDPQYIRDELRMLATESSLVCCLWPNAIGVSATHLFLSSARRVAAFCPLSGHVEFDYFWSTLTDSMKISPNYSLAVAAVYRNPVVHLISRNQTLGVLSFCNLALDSRTSSWVSDWSAY